MKFYNREREQVFFEKLVKAQGKKFVVLYGRRRIGKTFLMKKLFPDAKYFFVEVKRQEVLLKEFSQDISKAIFLNWYDFFIELFSKGKVIVFDEFQNFFLVEPSILSALQHAWDDTESEVKLIVLGSYVGLMKKLFMDNKLPLFGRSDYFIKLKPFGVLESVSILRKFGYSLKDAIEIYCITGGVPKYLLHFQDKRRLSDKIYELFIDEFGPLKEEAKNLLVLEFGSEHRSFFSILEAIGANSRSLSEISDLTGINSKSISKFLDDLLNAYDIVEREMPVFGRKTRGSKYIIKDKFYRFYFQLLYRNLKEIDFRPNEVHKRILENFPTYMGITFEDVCAEIFKEKGKELLGFAPQGIGKQWGKVPGTKNETYDIDIVVFDEEHIAFVECKWTNKKVGLETYRKLIERSTYINTANKQVSYVIVSKSGFTIDLLEMNDKSVFLFTPEELFAESK